MHSIIDLVSAYYKKENLIFEPDDTKLVINAKEQALLPYLYPVFKRDDFKKFYVASTLVQEHFVRLQEEVSEMFSAAKIKHMFVKGSVVYKYYDDSALRTRGDIDVLVEPNAFNRAIKVMEQNGFSMDECEHNYHIGFKKNNLEVELHRYLLPSDDSAFNYFKDAFQYADKKDEYLYQFEPIYELLFGITHFAHDLKRFGAGVRPLIDFKLIFEKEKIDYDLLRLELKRIGYLKLYENIICAIDSIFKIKYDDVEEHDVKDFIAFLEGSGIFGFANDRYEVERTQKKKSKFGLIMSRIFIPYTEMCLRHPILKSLPILLPLYYFGRGLRLLFTKFDRGRKLLNETGKNNDALSKMYDNLGL